MTSANPDAAPAQPAAQPKLGTIVLLGSLTAIGAMSIDLYLPSLPTIAADFRVDAGMVQRSMSAFFIGLALGQLVLGPVSDRFGRRPVLLVGAIVYVVASLGCAFAPTIGWLVTGRFVQALGACAGQVIARAVVRDRYRHQDSARILSLLALVMGVAPLIAPSIGVLLVTVASWRVIFGVLAAFGLAVGAATAWRLTESRSAATAVQARNESVVASYLGLLRQRRLLGYILAGALNGATILAYLVSAPDLMITILGFSPRVFALLFAANAVGVIGASQVNRVLLERYSADAILRVASYAGVVAGTGLLLAAATGAGGAPVLLGLLFATMTSFGFMAANAAAGALSIDPLRAGATSALIGAAGSGVGALAGIVTGVFHDGTPVPMAAMMAASLIGAALALHFLALPRTAVEAVDA